MQLILEQNALKIKFTFWEKVWAFHGDFTIPFSKIETVSTKQPPSTWKAIRCPGTALPGFIIAGTFYRKPDDRWQKEFWSWRRDQKFLVIGLSNHSYRFLILGIKSPENWKVRIDQERKRR